MSKKRFGGKRWLLAISTLLSCSCAAQDSNSGYRVMLPVLEVAPKVGRCQIQDPAAQTSHDGECTTLLSSDYKKLLIELVAACLGTGGTDAECRTGK